MFKPLEWIILIMAYLAAFFIYKSAKADPLADAAFKMGFKAPTSVYRAIEGAAKVYGLSAGEMLSIAIIESSLDPEAVNYNSNGTRDTGLFQINTVVANDECQEFNLFNPKGNSLCAAKVMSRHKSSGDPYYLGRYHSLTEAKKLEYYRKVHEVYYGR